MEVTQTVTRRQMKFVTVNYGGHTFKFYLNHYFDENSKRGDSANH
jgi:hypothetical protein